MKVVYEPSIQERVDLAILQAQQEGSGIVRIEMTKAEFGLFTGDAEVVSGEHILYRGVCIQTHDDYVDEGHEGFTAWEVFE